MKCAEEFKWNGKILENCKKANRKNFCRKGGVNTMFPIPVPIFIPHPVPNRVATENLPEIAQIVIAVLGIGTVIAGLFTIVIVMIDEIKDIRRSKQDKMRDKRGSKIREIRKCWICGTEMKKEYISLETDYVKHIPPINGVEAYVCPKCGEIVFSKSSVEQLMKEMRKNGEK